MYIAMKSTINHRITESNLRREYDTAGNLIDALIENEETSTAQSLMSLMSKNELLSRSTLISNFLRDIEDLISVDETLEESSTELDLRELQGQVHKWGKENFGLNISKINGIILGSLAPLIGMTEELGELNHAVLKYHQGIRGFNDEKYKAERDDALADILVYMCDFASREGVDLLSVLNDTWRKVVIKRDWKKNPEEGATNEKV